MNRALAAVAVASLSIQGASALRKGSSGAGEVEGQQPASQALVQQVALAASDELASSGFGEDCKFEVIDPRKCAEETARKCTKYCRAPLGLPDYPCGLKPGCSVNCPSIAECKVRLRASLTGDVNTETYDSIRVDFALQDYQVVRGHQLIKDFLQNTSHKAILTNLISDVLVDARGTVQQRLDVWKKDFKGLLVEKLGNDETFGDYSFLHGFVGNSTELVEALVPLSSMSFDTLRIANTDGEEQEPMVRSMLELPEARTYAELRFTHTLKHMNPFVRMAPGLLAGALVATKFPRIGLALGAISGGLLWYFTEALADSVGPRILGHSDVKFKAKLPEDAQKLGAPEQLEISAWFAGTSMYAAMQALPLNMVQSVLRNLALEATADPERIKNMPVKVVEANFKLSAERHHLAVAAGSYSDIEATIDLACMPNCPGPCGGFIRCG